MEEIKLVLCFYSRLRLVRRYKQVHLFLYQTMKGQSIFTETANISNDLFFTVKSVFHCPVAKFSKSVMAGGKKINVHRSQCV